jgi:hypothetical protein
VGSGLVGSLRTGRFIFFIFFLYISSASTKTDQDIGETDRLAGFDPLSFKFSVKTSAVEPKIG